MTYRSKFWLSAALALGCSAIVGLVIGTNVPASSGVSQPELVLPALLVLAGLLIIPTLIWWKRTDHVQQQGQLISWWWGGSAGAIAMIIVLAVMTGRHSDISLGAIYLFLAQFAGMAIVWIGWKMRGRGLAE